MAVKSNGLTRIAVLSDTHGVIDQVDKYLVEYGPFDLAIHAGDFISDIDGIKMALKHRGLDEERLLHGFYSVSGNCDEFHSPKEMLLNVDGIRILTLHGHESGVKSGLLQLHYQALEEKADIVVFGHTHIPVNVKEQGVLFFNPGSLTEPRGSAGPSFGILELGNKEIEDSSLIYV